MAGAIKSYRDLETWQKAMELVESAYRLARKLPGEEKFGLKSQMQRAAVSVPANIAEGHGRKHCKEFLRYLAIARGSLMELETHVLIAQRLGYVAQEDLAATLDLTGTVGRPLNGLIRALENRPPAPDP